MKTHKTFLMSRLVAMGLCWGSASAPAQTTPVLDGHAYTLTGDVTINISNQFIHFHSNMINCWRSLGSLPQESLAWTLITNNQFIGLRGFSYNTTLKTLFLSSETLDVVCDNAVYVDTLFADGFG